MVDSSGIGRIEEDLRTGRLWKARDRATGLFASRPTDQQVLSLTGEVYFRMGDLPRAASFWHLTERSGDDVDLAMSALRERYPRPSDLVAALPVRDEMQAFPEPVQARLIALKAEVKEQNGLDWAPGRRRSRSSVDQGPMSGLAGAGCIVAVMLGAVVFLIGLLAMVSELTSIL